MKYTIGLVAKLLDLSAEGLRLYEREGILETKRDNSRYRYYERLDITSLMRARSYQKYGFKLNEVEQLLNTDDLEFVLQSYAKKEQELNREILLRQMSLNKLTQLKGMIASFKDTLWQIQTEQRPAMYRYEYMYDDELIISKDKYPELKSWTSLTPFAFSSLRTDYTALCEGVDKSYSGIGLMESDIEALGAHTIVQTGTYLPETKCLTTVIEVSGEKTSNANNLSYLYTYAKDNHIEITGDAVSMSILSMNKKNNYTRYRKIWLPIK